MTEPRVLVGRYEIGRLVGRGGMAEVHAGWDTRLGREVAVKMLRSDLARDPSFIARFRREAQAVAGLNHPSIVAVYDSGEDTMIESGGASVPMPFIVMELVDGKTLRELLHEAGGPLPPAEACRIMAATLRALGFSHANGLIHRDIKPANVMTTADGKVKLTDFGIARAIADSAATMTNTSIVVGTAQYLSPEQAQGKPIDARADLYAAGCVLFELLTGRAPFTGDSPLAIAYQHVGQDPEPPSAYADGIAPGLDAITLLALEKEPADRYQSAAEFADDLEAVRAGRDPSPAALATLAARAAADGEVEPGPPEEVDPPGKEDHSTSAFPAVSAEEEARRRRRNRRRLGLLAAVTLVTVSVLAFLFSRGLLGPESPIVVPKVTGRSLQDATDELKRAGFVVAEPRQVSSTQATGTVVNQDPPAGREAGVGSRINLDVSRGAATFALRDLRGNFSDTAQSYLTEMGLLVRFEPVDSVDVGEGMVVSTKPVAGTEVSEGSEVILLVSTGQVTVPKVLGMTESEAKAALVQLRLVPEVTYVDDGGVPGTVTEQDYAGVSVKRGLKVKLTVVRLVPRPIPTTTVTQTVTAPPPTPTTTAPTTTSTTP